MSIPVDLARGGDGVGSVGIGDVVTGFFGFVRIGELEQIDVFRDRDRRGFGADLFVP